MQKWVENLIRYPEVKTIVFAFSVIVSGVLCSAFVAEITVAEILNWGLFYKTTTFWIIVIYCILLYFYNSTVYKYEKNVLKFLDDDYCLAYIRQQCLPDLVEKYKQDLKSGKQPKDFIDIKKELNKFNK
jgi:magnesium-transporting ATPase (P-type)